MASQCVVARRPVSRPAAARTRDPVQTDVVQVVAGSAAHEDDVRTRHVGQPGPGGYYQAALLVPDGPGAFGDEGHLSARKPAEHLVRADRVEAGKPVEEQDGDLHVTLLSC